MAKSLQQIGVEIEGLERQIIRIDNTILQAKSLVRRSEREKAGISEDEMRAVAEQMKVPAGGMDVAVNAVTPLDVESTLEKLLSSPAKSSKTAAANTKSVLVPKSALLDENEHAKVRPTERDALRRVTQAELQKAAKLLVNKGYRPVQLKGYAENQETRYDITWEKRGGPAWRLKWGLTTSAFEKHKQELAKDGFRVTLESSWEINGQRFRCALWEKNQSQPPDPAQPK